MTFQRFAGPIFGDGVGIVEVRDRCDGKANSESAQDEDNPIRKNVV